MLSRSEVEDLYRNSWMPKVLGMARAVRVQPADAEEILQEVAVDFWSRNLGGQEFEDPDHYVLRMASNALKRRFKRGRRWALIVRRLRRDVFAPDPTLLADGDLGPLTVAFSRLNFDERLLLKRCDVDGSADSEVAAGLNMTAGAVRVALMRARERLAALYIRELLGDREIRPACRRPMSLFPRWWAETITPQQVRELAQHLVGCSACLETKLLLKDHRRRVGVRQLFPLLDERDRKERLVAAFLLATAAAGDRSRRRRRWRWAPALLLLLLFVWLLPTARPWLGRLTPAAVAREPSPSPATSPLPTPSPSPPAPSPTATAALPALTGPPPFVSPCPPAAAGPYAFVDRGEVFYATAPGASAQKVTSTGGRADAIWWTPDGTRLLYKVAAAPPDIAGDVEMIDIRTRQQIWHLGAPTQFFALSPDGASWAAGSISVQNGNNVGMQVSVGSFPATSANPSASFLAPVLGSPIPYRASDYQDKGNLPFAASAVGPLNWLSGGIYVNDQGAGVYTPSGQSSGPYTLTPQLYDAFMGITYGRQFTLSWDRILTMSCAGQVTTLNNALLGIGPTWMSASSDGRTALVTSQQTGTTIDIVRLYADGRSQALTSDGASSLAEFQP